MIKKIQGVSEMTNEQLAEKVEQHLTRNREAKETSSPENHRRTSTEQKNQSTSS